MSLLFNQWRREDMTCTLDTLPFRGKIYENNASFHQIISTLKALKSLFNDYTVSHFSYAPLFQGPYFLTKMLESSILYDNLFIDILSVW